MILKEWLRKWNNGEFKEGYKNKKLFDIVCSADWRDWFCTEKELIKRTDKIGKLLSQITNDKILECYTIKLYNCCPAEDPLYDTIVFSKINDEKHGGFLDIGRKWGEKKYNFITYEDFENCNKEEFNQGKVFTIRTNNKKEIIDYFNNVDENLLLKN